MSSGLRAPVIITGRNDSGDIVLDWVRCSRIPDIFEDSWAQQYWVPPLDAPDERYEVDVVDNSGDVVRTLSVKNATTVTYTSSQQISDFGSAQSSYLFKVYQVDYNLGRGAGRSATVALASLPPFYHTYTADCEISSTSRITSLLSVAKASSVSFSASSAIQLSLQRGAPQALTLSSTASITGSLNVARMFVASLSATASIDISTVQDANILDFSLNSLASLSGEVKFDALSAPAFSATAAMTGDMVALSGARTGQLAVTLGAVTVSATAARETHGALTATLGALTTSATGVVAIKGALVQTLAPVTLSSTSGIVSYLSLDVTLDAVTVSATAARETHGALAVTLGALTSSATATRTTHGALAVTLGAVTVSSTATRTTHGALTTTLASVGLSATAGTPRSAALSVTLGALSLSGTATATNTGQLAVTLGSLSLSSAMTVTSAPQVVFITTTGASTWTVPSGCTTAQVECIGAGGSGYPGGVSPTRGGGGGGGAYSRTNSVSLTPGATVYVSVGAVAADTWFNNAANSAPASTTNGCLAKGGTTASSTSGGAGGTATSSVGDTKYAGGTGGASGGTGDGGGGGGGAGGPSGAGATGASCSGQGAGGGGGANGGSTPTAPTGDNGGAGGNNASSTGGGTGGTSGTPNGGAGSAGGGGGGGYSNGFSTFGNGGAGGASTTFDASHGCGGGGGGGSATFSGGTTGGGGGLYGGGGGGATGGSQGTGGTGAQGLIVITYTPAVTNIDGALASTLGALTSSAAAQLTTHGALATTFGPVTSSAAAQLTTHGALSTTLGAVTLSAAVAPTMISFTHTGSTFSPRITVTGTPTILWTFSDATTSNSATPSKDFGSAATRTTTLVVTPWSALTGINIGYDAADGGSGSIDLVTQQNVTTVSGLSLVSSSLTLWCSSHNPITSLDFTNFLALDTVECYQCSSLSSVLLSGTTSITRLCLEQCYLSALNISDCMSLMDFRAAVQRGGNQAFDITWGVHPSAWHVCVRDNALTSDIPDTFLAHVEELWIWNCNQSGAFSLETDSITSLGANTNGFTSADLNGLIPAGRNAEIDFYNNDLTTLDITGCPGISSLNIRANNFSQSALDSVLTTLEAFNTSNGTLDTRENVSPSAAGVEAVNALISRGWTVQGTETFLPTPASASLTITGYAPTFPSVGPVLTYIGTHVDENSTQTRTYTNVSIGTAAADRLVVVCVMAGGGSDAPTSITVGGNSATIHAQGEASYWQNASIASLTVASGTTATIAVTLGSADGGPCVISVYTITNLSSTTPQDTDFNGGVDPINLQVNVPSGALVIGCAHGGDANAAYTVTGLTSDVSGVDSFYNYWAGSAVDLAADTTYDVQFSRGNSWSAAAIVVWL